VIVVLENGTACTSSPYKVCTNVTLKRFIAHMGEKGKAHRMKVGGRGDRDCEMRSVTLEMDSGDSGRQSIGGLP
jgi:hypothetical protein